MRQRHLATATHHHGDCRPRPEPAIDAETPIAYERNRYQTNEKPSDLSSGASQTHYELFSSKLGLG